MDTSTQHALIALNNRFYEEHAASFSATREAAWGGWERVGDLANELIFAARDELDDSGHARTRPTRVFDLACGNLRFERFLIQRFPAADLDMHAVDACDDLARDRIATTRADESTRARSQTVTFHHLDILGAMLEAGRLDGAGAHLPLDIAPCDLVACFGFMHHVPGRALRARVLEELVGRALPGGIIAVSFWQFMNDARLARKAQSADDFLRMASTWRGISPAALEENDHFLGWQEDPRPLRYCHHTSDDEVDELVASVGTGAREVARYSADGASGTLNRYVILQRLP